MENKNLQILARLKCLAWLKKALLFMKIIFFLLFLSVEISLAAPSYAQNTSLSLKMNNATVAEILDAIEKQTEFRFYYNSKLVDTERETSIDVKDDNVFTTLDKLFAGTNVSYKVIDKDIILTVKQADMKNATGKIVAGIVTDMKGEPIPGVSVIVKGTTIGVSTDITGKYSIDVPNQEAILVLSYLGYVSQEILVRDRTLINVTMTEATRQIEEVVVVGYGTQKKVNLTGSVISVDMNKMTDGRPITNLSEGLSGMAAGVTVTQGSGGRPGYDEATIRIRGQGTLNNSDPLIVVDGMESSINDLNPQDVESISILKDAASSAIYGSRAANGVVLITTKKGRAGTAKISYNGYLSSQKVAQKLDYVTNYADYMELINEGFKNSGQAVPFSQAKIDEWRNAGNSDPVKYPNTDWQDFAFKQGWMQNHMLSASGGTDKIHYLVSGNYMTNQGIMENSGYNRISAHANFDADVKTWFKIGVNSYGYKGVADLGMGADGNFGNLVNTTPGMCFRAPDGRYGGVNNTEDNIQSGVNNILRQLNSVKGNSTTNKLVSRFYGQLKPLRGLSIEGSFTYNFTNTYLYQQPVFFDLWNFYDNTIQTLGTGRTQVTNKDEKWIRNQMDGIIRYENKINLLNIQVMAGASQESYRDQWFAASKMDLSSPELTELNAATMDAAATGTYTNWAMHSYFGRLNLNWAEKYLFEANLRMDYSSRFAPGATRRGVFPSFSAGWRINDESFMQDISWLNSLKLRFSYGGLGNNSIGNYDYQELYANRNYVLNNTVQVGWAQTALSNAKVTWETTYVSNAGVDFDLWKSKWTGIIEVFEKNTKNILINLPAPLVNGNASIPKQNAGEVRNRGIDFTLSWNDKVGNVRYFVGGNFSYVKNKLTKFKGAESTITGTNLLLEGYPINIQYVMKVDRLVQSDDDLAYVQSLVDKNPDYFKNYTRPQKGDFLYADTNGDGALTSDDRIKIGNGPNPTVIYALNLGASWKGFDFSALLQGIGGLFVYWDGSDAAQYRSMVMRGSQLNKTITDGRWYDGRTDATFPRLLTNDQRNFIASDFYVYDKSYMRLKNVQLGYTIPKSISQKLSIEALRFYASIENALTFTNYPGLDPEVNGTNYPTFRTTTVGVNLTF